MQVSRVKELKDIGLEYQSALAMTVKVYTDLPGNAMALRATLTFPASATTRKTHWLPLDATEGTLIQVEVTSTGVVKLFGGIVRIRPIGVYFDGANAEKFITQELSIGMD